MANVTVYMLKVSNSRRVDRHLRYPGNCEGQMLGGTRHRMLSNSRDENADALYDVTGNICETIMRMRCMT